MLKTLENSGLTDFPQACSQFLVLVERTSKLVAIIEITRESEQLIWRNHLVDVALPQQLARGLDQQKLQHAFNDYLLKDLMSLGNGNLCGRFRKVTTR